MNADPPSSTPVVYLGDAARDAEFVRTLAQRYRVYAPSGTEETQPIGEFVRGMVGGPAHVIAEADASPSVCWLAILEPALVQSLVLVRPTFGDDSDLLERLGEIRVPTLVLCGASDKPGAGQLVVQRVPDSYRVVVYAPATACARFAELAMEFFERGDRFVVAESAAGRGR